MNVLNFNEEKYRIKLKKIILKKAEKEGLEGAVEMLTSAFLRGEPSKNKTIGYTWALSVLAWEGYWTKKDVIDFLEQYGLVKDPVKSPKTP